MGCQMWQQAPAENFAPPFEVGSLTGLALELHLFGAGITSLCHHTQLF